MASRLELHEELCDLLGSREAYFQPPATVTMHYPAIVYRKHSLDNIAADNIHYLQHRGYELTVIDKDPDSKVDEAVSKLPRCRFNRSYASDGLNHFVYILYY